MLLFVIILFLIFPIASTPLVLLGLVYDRKYYKIYILLLTLVMSAVGYSFIPNPDSDLTRHFVLIDIYRAQGFSDVLLNSGGLYFQDIVFYLIALTNNHQLLPAVAAFFTYGCIFYIIANYTHREGVSHGITVVFIVLFVLTLGFQTPLSGIRNSWAFAMLFFAVYRDLIQKKKNLLTYTFYILPLFMHFSALVLLLLRIMLPLFKRLNKVMAGVLMFLYPLCIGFFISVFERISSVNSYFNVFTKKLNYTSQRLNNEFTIGYSMQSGDFTNTFRKLGTTAILILICILIFTVLYYIFKNKPEKYRENKEYYTFIILLCIFSLGSISYVIVFERFSLSIIYICSPIFITYWKLIKKDIKVKLRVLEYSFIVFIFFVYGLIFTIKRNLNYPEWLSSFPSSVVKNIFNAFTYLRL